MTSEVLRFRRASRRSIVQMKCQSAQQSFSFVGARRTGNEGTKLTSYNGFAPRFKVFVPRTAFGWVRPYAHGVPEKWPVDFGWMNAYPVEGYDIESPRGFMMSISKARDN